MLGCSDITAKISFSCPAFESDTDPGPLGAQYSPVLDMSKVSTKSIRDFAETSGVTASLVVSSPSQYNDMFRLASSVIPEFIESHPLSHFGPHKGWMDNTDCDTLVVQVEAE